MSLGRRLCNAAWRDPRNKKTFCPSVSKRFTRIQAATKAGWDDMGANFASLSGLS